MAADTVPPVDPSRRALLVGGIVAAGGAAIAAGSARSQSAPDPLAGHDLSAMTTDPYAAPMPGMAHGNMTTVGLVDHERNGFDPTAMLTDWETGRTELLPDGRTLRTSKSMPLTTKSRLPPASSFPPGPSMAGFPVRPCGPRKASV